MINRNIPLQFFTLALLFLIQFLVPATRSEASEVNIVINEISWNSTQRMMKIRLLSHIHLFISFMMSWCST